MKENDTLTTKPIRKFSTSLRYFIKEEFAKETESQSPCETSLNGSSPSTPLTRSEQ